MLDNLIGMVLMVTDKATRLVIECMSSFHVHNISTPSQENTQELVSSKVF